MPLAAQVTVPTVVAFPSADETRAFLLPPTAAAAVAPGHWALRLTFRGDAAPDLSDDRSAARRFWRKRSSGSTSNCAPGLADVRAVFRV